MNNSNIEQLPNKCDYLGRVTCFEPSILSELLLGGLGLVVILMEHVRALDQQLPGLTGAHTALGVVSLRQDLVTTSLFPAVWNSFMLMIKARIMTAYLTSLAWTPGSGVPTKPGSRVP